MRKVVTALVVGALFAAGPALAQAKSGKGGGSEQLNLFSEAYDRIRQDAVEPVGEGKLIGAAIGGMLSGLDARSAYINEAAYRAMQTPANEDQVSLGLVVTIENGQLKVIAPQDGSPAAQAGIKPGDLIYAIDKDPTYDLTLGEAEQKLRGPAGSQVELSLRRDNRGPIEVKVKRERYKLQMVAGRIEAGNILYLRIAGFDPATAAALTSTVQDLRQRAGNKVIGFILDLRNNPGGAFEAAVAVADAFIDKGDIVVVKGRKPGSLKRISATPGDIAQGLPIVALINGGTAREAELVAAGLHIHEDKVAIVVAGGRVLDVGSLIGKGYGRSGHDGAGRINHRAVGFAASGLRQCWKAKRETENHRRESRSLCQVHRFLHRCRAGQSGRAGRTSLLTEGLQREKPISRFHL